MSVVNKLRASLRYSIFGFNGLLKATVVAAEIQTHNVQTINTLARSLNRYNTTTPKHLAIGMICFHDNSYQFSLWGLGRTLGFSDCGHVMLFLRFL